LNQTVTDNKKAVLLHRVPREEKAVCPSDAISHRGAYASLITPTVLSHLVKLFEEANRKSNRAFGFLPSSRPNHSAKKTVLLLQGNCATPL